MNIPHFIVNPLAGGGKAHPSFFNELGKCGTVSYTKRPGHATELAREALKAGKNLIVAVGGDGTLNEVINGFFIGDRLIQASSELGIIGLGTGCDTIKTLRISPDPSKALHQLLTSQARPVDLCRARFQHPGGHQAARYFINIAEAGLGGAVVATANKSSKKLGGFTTFLLSTLSTVLRYRNTPIEIQIDGEAPRSIIASNVIVGNGKYFGGGMKILPHAKFDDQRLEILIMGNLTRLEILRNLGGVYFGTHLAHPLVECFQAKHLKITSPFALPLDLDGEQPGTTPAEFELLPHALQVRLPR